MAQTKDSASGLAFAVSAYTLWGGLPIYLKWLEDVPALEIVAHRVLWSLPIAALVVALTRGFTDLRVVFGSWRSLVMGLFTATLVSANWSIYVWSVANDRAIDAALGYYINPLFSVALGALLLGETLTRLQLVAVALVVLAVAYLTFDAGGVPWVAIGLSVTWGFYALAKKELPIGANQGFLLEVVILAPIALIFLTVAEISHFRADATTMWLLVGTGFMTAVPLLLYANGAKRLRLSTIGILQYIAPTCIFLTALFVFNEPYDSARRVAFPLIWLALALYSWSMVREMRRGA